MGRYVLGFKEINQTHVAVVGGKGAQLGELSRIEGVSVPRGFCVTTVAFQKILAEVPSIEKRIDRLSRLHPDELEPIRALSAEIRRSIEEVTVPDDVAAAISRSLAQLGARAVYAVRSSATAEDLPAASFAGQQETYLNVVGRAAILAHVSRCWASLFTERAVIYRMRAGLAHLKVQMGVVVQHMVFPQVAGVLFTADPVTSNRTISAVEAVFGLGEALVSGLVNADSYRVRNGEVIETLIATKTAALRPSPTGGTLEVAIAPERQAQPVLTDAQAVRLAQLGRRIEAHFGQPQDLEWCLVNDAFQILQSRPITTLFPIPESSDGENHVYVSVGHGQMMTDPMKPLGLSLFQLTAARPMYTAGGRLFVDVTRALASPASRASLLEVMGKGDPLIGDALKTILDRDDFVKTIEDEEPRGTPASTSPDPIETDPTVVDKLIEQSQASISDLKRDISTKSGPALLDFILTDIQELKRILFDPRSGQVIMAGMEAVWWLNEHLETWLNEKNAAGTLTQSVPNNVSSEMGLALLDVADVIRPHTEVVSFLQHVDGDGFLDKMTSLQGGPEARLAIRAYLDKYGMRCVGEIDITRPRWSEQPATLLPVILSNIKNFEPGEGKRRFEQGLQEAQTRERELLQRLRALPDGERKAAETKQMIDRARSLVGYREYPKYGMVSRYFVYKLALLKEAERLVQTGVLGDKEDIFYLTLQELHDVVQSHRVDAQLLQQRKDAFRSFTALQPPRVLTSDGEVISGTYRRDDLPAGALLGIAVSAGAIEGRARVVLGMQEADLDVGDILVTAHTDPSWTPLFVTIKGLVTEVGGLMTHGAVIAREYGLPAVVGVEHATALIKDGQRIRVNGTDGFVEILS